ncbi:MAG: class IV adenylate cyclase [Patescibacteria group bacterium]|nr:class IV adenylate cyclase [Patescibacteria group bacterium]
MAHLNIEIKAKSNNQAKIKKILKSKNADFKGVDHQLDTYFKINFGRLKLREGKIENYLIYYQRKNKKGPKQSDVVLFKPDPKSSLKEILTKALGVLTVVDKKREIYFIDNVKFHIDEVKNLGTFIEIEAIDTDGTMGKDQLLEQCRSFLDLFEISQKDLISVSYSDLLLKKH